MIIDVLSPLHKAQDSSTFQQLWAQHGKKAQTARKNDEAQKRDLSISNVVENVWKPAYEAWIQFVGSLWDGTLTLGDVDKLFESYKGRKEEMVQELFCIFNLRQTRGVIGTKEVKAKVEERVTQIQRYQHLHQYASAADTIWEFKEAMGFSGDFKVIEDLRDQVSVITKES